MVIPNEVDLKTRAVVNNADIASTLLRAANLDEAAILIERSSRRVNAERPFMLNGSAKNPTVVVKEQSSKLETDCLRLKGQPETCPSAEIQSALRNTAYVAGELQLLLGQMGF